MNKIREQTISVSKELVRPKVLVRTDTTGIADSSATEYIMAIATAAMRTDQLTEDSVTTARKVLDSVDLGWIDNWRRSKEADVTIIRENLINDVILPLSWTLPALYMLAALTFPHEATARYPAPLGAPDDAIEAARCGKLGTRHYTKSLGIVEQLSQLHKLTEMVLAHMKPLLAHAVESSEHRT